VAFATPEEATVHSATPFDTFSNADELAQLATAWPAERLLAVWNSVPGLTHATEIKAAAKAAKLIFQRLEKDGTKPARAKKPKAGGKAKGGGQAAKGAPAKATKKPLLPTTRPRVRKPQKRAKRASRAKAARWPRWWRCSNARTVPALPRS